MKKRSFDLLGITEFGCIGKEIFNCGQFADIVDLAVNDIQVDFRRSRADNDRRFYQLLNAGILFLQLCF